MMRPTFKLLLAIFLLVSFAGCATGPNANPADPLEPMNRAVYKFNDAVDGTVLKPVATGYKNVVPSPVRTGISNFFSNLGDVWSFFNHLLQFEFGYAGQTAIRFGANTFLGLGGILDIATEAGVHPPRADLGQTFGKWGIPSGPYVMLPILGPSSVRDGMGAITATYYDPINSVPNTATRNVVTATRIVNVRAQLLNATDAVDEIALDKYSFIRDVYLKRRLNQISPPKPSNEDDIDYSAAALAKPTPEQAIPKLPPLPITLPALPSIR